MSTRMGYYYLAEEVYDGPFTTISEAKDAVSQDARISSTSEVSIRAMVTLETRDRYGAWETVH